MQEIVVKYQTSELVPPPHAQAIELRLSVTQSQSLELKIGMYFLDREDFTQEELEEEGYTGQDDLEENISLPTAWKAVLEQLLKKTKSVEKQFLAESEAYWEIQVDNQPAFYPANEEEWQAFLNELVQAVFEASNREKPMEITLQRIDGGLKKTHQIKASFVERSLVRVHNQTSGKPVREELTWEELNKLLKQIYSGEMLYEEATNTEPNKTGMYVSMGDGWWFEVGKSYLISPRKVLRTFGAE